MSDPRKMAIAAMRLLSALLFAVSVGCQRQDDPERQGTAGRTLEGATGTCLLDRTTRQVLGRLIGYSDSPTGRTDQYGLLRPGANRVEWIATSLAETVECDAVWKLTHPAV